MGRRNDIDWEAVSRDYRIGQLSIREVAEKYDIAPSAITRRAKKEGWTRDLTKEVRVATKAKVMKKVIADAEAELKGQIKESTQESAQQSAQRTFSEVDLAANVNATIIGRHQTRAARLSSLLDKTLDDMEAMAGSPMALEDIAAAIKEEDPLAAQAIKRLKSTTSRMNNLKVASEVLTKVKDIEREAFNIDDSKSGETVDDKIRALRKRLGE